jgi:hypothetical protein
LAPFTRVVKGLAIVIVVVFVLENCILFCFFACNTTIHVDVKNISIFSDCSYIEDNLKINTGKYAS